MRVMGLDIGTRRIGVAVSDEIGIIATGREVIPRKSNEFALGRIKEMLEEYNVLKIVVGLPVNMDATEGERADDSRRFAALLEENTGLSVELWDERLSTKEAEDMMIKADTSRAKRKKVIDKIAAQIILQGYLDSSPGREEQDV